MITKEDLDTFERELRCSICLEIWTDPAATPCNHVFCRGCIEQSLRNKHQCPICKFPFFKRALGRMQTLKSIVDAYYVLVSKLNDGKEETNKEPDFDFSKSVPIHNIDELYPYPEKTKKNEDTVLEERIVRRKKRKSSTSRETSDTEENVGETSINTNMTVEEIENELKRKRETIEKIDATIREIDTNGMQNIDLENNEFLSTIVASASDQLEQRVPKRQKTKHSFKTPNQPNLLNTPSSSESNSISPSFTPVNPVNTTKSPLIDPRRLSFGTPKLNERTPIRASTSSEDERAKVFVATVLDEKQKKKLKRVARLLGARVVSKMTPQVTHVVTKVDESNIARRSMKYSSGIICGAWIVSFQYIEDSFKEQRWLNEEDYEVKGDAQYEGGPQKGRLARMNESAGLFAGMYMHFSGVFCFPNPSKTELQNLVKWGGAQILRSPPKKSELKAKRKGGKDRTPPKTRENTFIIVDKERSDAELDELYEKSGCKPIVYTWLLDCVSSYELLAKDDFYAKFFD